ncbi:hypothetical protein [Psychrobacter sp. ASPA161_9]|uniref:hypothetical protein n=1 Tax=Psychrobacter sp. ASPA161_9 TaxID=3160961 RepID=UPI003F7DE4FD
MKQTLFILLATLLSATSYSANAMVPSIAFADEMNDIQKPAASTELKKMRLECRANLDMDRSQGQLSVTEKEAMKKCIASKQA